MRLIPEQSLFPLICFVSLLLFPATGFSLAWSSIKATHEWSEPPSWFAEVAEPKTAPDPTWPKLASLIPDDDSQRTPERWQKERVELRKRWEEILRSPLYPQRKRPDFEVLESEVTGEPPVERKRIRFEVEPDVFCEAYLLLPHREGKQEKPRLPGVVVFHSTVASAIRQPAGVEGEAEKAFGLHLAQRGYVTLSPRNFLWPDNHHIDTDITMKEFRVRHPQATGMAKMLHDAQVALDLLCSLDEVDSERIGAVGHSLGAKEVLYLAAFDERVKATVSSEGGVGISYSNWNADWYLGKQVADPDFKHDHHEIVAMIAPRAFLLVGGESADGEKSWPYIQRAREVYKVYSPKPALGFWNHRQGHTVPSEEVKRMTEWLDYYLQPNPKETPLPKP